MWDSPLCCCIAVYRRVGGEGRLCWMQEELHINTRWAFCLKCRNKRLEVNSAIPLTYYLMGLYMYKIRIYLYIIHTTVIF